MKDNGWKFDCLYTVLPSELKNRVQSTAGPTGVEHVDAWRWNEEPDGHYTSRSAYAWLNHRDNEEGEHQVWMQLLKLRIPGKCKFMIWLALHQSLPVNVHWHACSLATSAACGRCSAPTEDILHCLRDCPHSREVWTRLGYGTFVGFFSQDSWSWILAILRQEDSGRILYI